MTDVLELHEVTKRYGNFLAVDRLSFRVPKGQILGFLGANGAGKTTTIRMIMSITYPDSGSLSVLGHPRAIEVKDRIGYLPEERGLYPKMTVDSTLRYFGALRGMSRAALRQRIPDLLDRVGLREWQRKTVQSLSKGMSQKIQFVATILNDPELVILDEPFSGLDPLNRDLLEDLLIGLKKANRTVIFSTHQLEQAERLCDRILLINRGRKLIEGTVAEVRAGFPARTLVMAGEGDFRPLADCPGLIDAHITVGGAQLELQDGADPNVVLRKAVETVRLSRFEIQRPDLQEIFVRLVAQDRQPPASAAPDHPNGALAPPA